MTSKRGKCFGKALLNTTLSVGVTIVGDVVVEEINKVRGEVEVEVEGEDEEEDEVEVEGEGEGEGKEGANENYVQILCYKNILKFEFIILQEKTYVFNY